MRGCCRARSPCWCRIRPAGSRWRAGRTATLGRAGAARRRCWPAYGWPVLQSSANRAGGADPRRLDRGARLHPGGRRPRDRRGRAARDAVDRGRSAPLRGRRRRGGGPRPGRWASASCPRRSTGSTTSTPRRMPTRSGRTCRSTTRSRMSSRARAARRAADPRARDRNGGDGAGGCWRATRTRRWSGIDENERDARGPRSGAAGCAGLAARGPDRGSAAGRSVRPGRERAVRAPPRRGPRRPICSRGCAGRARAGRAVRDGRRGRAGRPGRRAHAADARATTSPSPLADQMRWLDGGRVRRRAWRGRTAIWRCSWRRGESPAKLTLALLDADCARLLGRTVSADLPPDFFNRPLAEVDPEIAEVLALELERQQRTLEMIASENFVPGGGARVPGIGADEQVRRGLPGQALLRRLRVRRRRRAAGDRPRARSCSAPSTPTSSRTRARRQTPPCTTR